MDRILIVGAGAVGSTLAWHLAGTRASVALLARGERAEILERQGLTLWRDGQDMGRRHLPILTQPQGSWDAILLCVKQYDLPQALRTFTALGDAPLIPLINGIPWWLLQRHPRLRGQSGWGEFYASFPAVALSRVLGSVVYIPARMRDAANVEQGGRDALALGEIDGPPRARTEALAATLNAGGLQCKVSQHIEADIWNKLLGNATFNPVSALANATMQQMLTHADLRQLCARLIAELMAVGAALGYQEAQGVEGRLRQAESAGHARTSMLQDASAGRPLESEALVGIVTRIAAHLHIPTPILDSIWALLHSRFPLPSGQPGS
ncbi:ketopantoate reductase family protein [Bordetella avium]|uniref:ketopantoate reductase family protein n=1 Tax=Bordetella avium TaxID=521 RepID=UPI000E0B3B7F|nr:2-dehydropantoate 2-reductase [Bordetella avium]AZY51261.1 hypothetical protein C0J07_01125 [Bordetella avium]RIQ14884.1 2-dehydropantoate 2-reductase [Bordetella avium]RIQ18625.1 2-dehydropantoate 2-reductase [Bordetella avium]RIQ35339.1 2-dehydropantoate 2-reductase [Bordetella avium]RIQ41348.1 2-dehydropantoate 2-reductase [Bordetella avium]